MTVPTHWYIKPLPNDKILGRSKLKIFADYNIKAAQMAEVVSDRIENNAGKGKKILGSSIFSL